MTFGKVFLFTAAALISVPAIPGVIVIGNSSARSCYETAESQRRPSTDQMRQCDRALTEEALTPYEVVATHVNRGVLHLRRGAVEASMRDFDRAILLDANEPEAYLNNGAVLIRAGQFGAALPWFSMALEKETRKPAFAYYGRGVAHEEMGDIQSAYLDYRRASVADPEWTTARDELTRFTVRRP